MKNRPPDNSQLQSLLSSTKDTSLADTCGTDTKDPCSAPKDAAQLLTSLKSGSAESPSHLMAANVTSPVPRRHHSFPLNPELFEGESRSPDPKHASLQYSNNIESQNFSPNTGAKRQQVKNACTNCQKACKKCDDQRPCSRCIKYHLESNCTNSARKERKKGIKRGPYKRKYGEGDSLSSRSIVSTASLHNVYHPYLRTGADDASFHWHQPFLFPNLAQQAIAEPLRHQCEPQSRSSPTVTVSRYAPPSYGCSSGADPRSPHAYKGSYSHLVEPKPSQCRSSTISPMSAVSSALPSLSELHYAETSSAQSPSSHGWYARSRSATPATLPPPAPIPAAPFPLAVPSSLYGGSIRSLHGPSAASLGLFSAHSPSPSPFFLQGPPYDTLSHRGWPSGPSSACVGATHARNTSSSSSFDLNTSFRLSDPAYPAPHGLNGHQMLSFDEESSSRHPPNASPTYPGSSVAHSGVVTPALASAPHVFPRSSSSFLRLPPLMGNTSGRPPWEQRRTKGSSGEQDTLLYGLPAAYEPSAKAPSTEGYVKTTGSGRLASLLSEDSDQPVARSRGLDELSEICSVEIDSSDMAKMSNRKAKAA